MFSGLTKLKTIQLASNRLRTLPDGVFAGLTDLELLVLADNSGLLPVMVTLETVAGGQVRAKVLAGAPSDLALRVSVETLAPAWGAASGGAERLWSLRDARAFAANDAFDPAGRLDAEAGYGLGAFGGRRLMTPYAGLALSETGGRAWRTGVRWTLGPGVAFGVEGTRGEPANADAPEHGLAFRATLRW